LGEYDEAIKWLEKAYEDCVSLLITINEDLFFAKLRPEISIPDEKVRHP